MGIDIAASLDIKARETSFSGVVEVVSAECSFRKSLGYRDRANKLKIDCDTRFGTASGTKGFTALAVASLVESGEIRMDTKAVSILADRFPELHPDITIQQLLAHTSGVGDHYDEELIQGGVDDFFLSIPVQDLVSPFDYLPLLRERPQKFAPGDRACYSNGGYVLLAMIIESVSGMDFQRYVEERVFHPSGMRCSGFFRSDDLPENAALGYLAGENDSRTNALNLPVIGSGDGGAYSCLEDMKSFWRSLLSLKIVTKPTLDQMIQPRNRIENSDYGLGFWIEAGGNFITLEGYDAGVSFYSGCSRDLKTQFTVISNDRLGAWPIVKALKKSLL
ncbi:MAG: beta-lactamase family protein [Opitutales bacterium]|nr:beta-lactamase family protein [Opitutales bacterium]NRA27977.1 beta-lactamase family protein [Opitutales bacterium]